MKDFPVQLALLTLITGIALGTAATLYLKRGHDVPDEVVAGSDHGGAPSSIGKPKLPGDAISLPVAGGFSERSTIYRLAADADVDSLRSLIEEGAAHPESLQRRFLLATLLSRYAELDPHEAIARAVDLKLDPSMVAALYASWVSVEPSAAMDAWSLVDEPRQAQAIGLVLFQTLGGDEQALSRVLTSLPSGLDANRFQVEAIGLWAKTEPEMALRKTLTLDGRATQSKALEKIAGAWAERAPRAALSALGSIEDLEFRNAFQGWVIRDWSSVEPESALEYVVGLGDTSQSGLMLAHTAFKEIALSNPLRALELADALPSLGNRMAKQIALQVWADEDASGALAYVEGLPGGQQRQQLLGTVARAYGREDPEAALAWARNLKPRPQGVLSAVVGGIAGSDPDLALDIVMTLDSDQAQMETLSSIAMVAAYSRSPESIANRLVSLPDGTHKAQALQMLTSTWVQTDPEATLGWLLANVEQAGVQSFSNIARQLAHLDPEMAVRFTSKVPAAARGAWVQQVAQGYARVDPAGALDWIRQYQGEPAYEVGLAAVIQHSAKTDPRGAAGLLETIADSPQASSAARGIAAHWARTEPRSAAAWAKGLGEGQARAVAIAGVAQQWAGSDPQAARRWVLDLPADSDRDAALVSLLQIVASKEIPDEALFSAFSSNTTRQQALPAVVYYVAQRDPDAARGLIDKYVSDSATRRQLEQMLLSGRTQTLGSMAQ